MSSSRSQEQTPIFVLSLRRSTERRRAIAAHLTHLGLNFVFFDAIEGQAVPPDLEHLIDRDYTKAHRLLGTGLTPGEVGCALSHALLYQKLVEEKIPEAFILEDDVILSAKFAELVKGRSLIQPKIGLATLVYSPTYVSRWGRLELGDGIQARRPLSTPFCTACYFLTLETAKRLLKASLPISHVADWPFPIHRWRGTYCITPAIAAHPPEAEASLLAQDRSPLLAQRLAYHIHIEEPAHQRWPTPLRILGRLASFTLLPCLLWPRTFGSVRGTIKFAQRLIEGLLWPCRGELVEALHLQTSASLENTRQD